MLCRLYNLNEAIENSHVVPRLVYRAIKSDSPTGFLRGCETPNQRLQDGDKQPLLCLECEARFSVAEKSFAQNIFVPFHERDEDRFSYGPWLHYFLTSLAWRTLVLELPGLEADTTILSRFLDPVRAAIRTMQSYLCGATHLGHLIRHHALIWTGGDDCSPAIAAVGPNVLIRRSTIGYSLIEKLHGYAAVVHNLAGIITMLNIKGNPQDNWFNTRIAPGGGTIAQPQKVYSWVVQDLLDTMIDCRKAISDGMSDKQHKSLLERMGANPTARSLRHVVRDAHIEVMGD